MTASARLGGALALGRRVAELLVAGLFGAILVLFLANVAGRFLFRAPIVWADEALVLAMLWVTFLTTAFVLDESDHVAFDLLYQRFGPSGRRALLTIGLLAVAGIFLAAAPALLGYVAFLWRERTAILEIPLHLAYAVFGVFVVMLIAQRLWLAARLWRGDGAAALAAIEGRADEGRAS